MKLVDSHAHLDDPRFAEDLEAVMERADRQGVDTVLTVGCLGEDEGVPERVQALLDRWPSVRAAFGVHPHDARWLSDGLERRLEELVRQPRVLAVGEIGLDYHYDHSPRDVQREAFGRQIRLARRQDKPIIVHTREAEADTIDIIEREFDESSTCPGVLHCFTGSAKLADACLRRGFFVSFGGILTFKKADALREVARRVPIERLLVETDCPYLAPVPHRGKRNEPAYVDLVLQTLAEIRELSAEALASQIVRNFESLFRPSGHPSPAGSTDPSVPEADSTA